MIFTYFASSSLSKFCWHSSFNLVRGTCCLYCRYIFFVRIFVILFARNINAERKKTRHSIAVGEHNKKKKGKWKIVAKLEYNVNVQKQPPEVFLKICLKNLIIFIGKHVCWRCFPVNIAKFLRTIILENICKWLLLNVVSNNNEEQHLLAKLDKIAKRKIFKNAPVTESLF